MLIFFRQGQHRALTKTILKIFYTSFAPFVSCLHALCIFCALPSCPSWPMSHLVKFLLPDICSCRLRCPTTSDMKSAKGTKVLKTRLFCPHQPWVEKVQTGLIAESGIEVSPPPLPWRVQGVQKVWRVAKSMKALKTRILCPHCPWV